MLSNVYSFKLFKQNIIKFLRREFVLSHIWEQSVCSLHSGISRVSLKILDRESERESIEGIDGRGGRRLKKNPHNSSRQLIPDAAKKWIGRFHTTVTLSYTHNHQLFFQGVSNYRTQVDVTRLNL